MFPELLTTAPGGRFEGIFLAESVRSSMESHSDPREPPSVGVGGVIVVSGAGVVGGVFNAESTVGWLLSLEFSSSGEVVRTSTGIGGTRGGSSADFFVLFAPELPLLLPPNIPSPLLLSLDFAVSRSGLVLALLFVDVDF